MSVSKIGEFVLKNITKDNTKLRIATTKIINYVFSDKLLGNNLIAKKTDKKLLLVLFFKISDLYKAKTNFNITDKELSTIIDTVKHMNKNKLSKSMFAIAESFDMCKGCFESKKDINNIKYMAFHSESDSDSDSDNNSYGDSDSDSE
jgi:hypothetical protein